MTMAALNKSFLVGKFLSSATYPSAFPLLAAASITTPDHTSLLTTPQGHCQIPIPSTSQGPVPISSSSFFPSLSSSSVFCSVSSSSVGVGLTKVWLRLNQSSNAKVTGCLSSLLERALARSHLSQPGH